MRRYTYIFLISFSVINLFFLLFLPDDSSAESYRFRRLQLKRYILYGYIGLSYERRWSGEDTGSATTEFIQDYNLGLKGYIIDQRLINFDISGSLTMSSRNVGEGYTLTGTRLNLNLLETFPRGWWRYRKFIPNPVMLRYSSSSNYYDYTNYGVTLNYSPGRIWGSDGSKKGGFFFPSTIIDYDRYDFRSKDYVNVTDVLSLRSELKGEHYLYNFFYENFNQTGTIEYKRNTIELRPDYRFYNQETRKSLNISNLLRLEEINDRKSLNLSSRASLLKPMDKDILSLLGGIEYSATSNAEDTKSYNASASGSYMKVVSPRLTHMTSLSLGFGQSNGRNIYSGRLGENVTVDISRIFRGSGSIFLGNTQEGVDYGLGANLSTKTRICVSTGYNFTSLSLEEGKTLRHELNIDASGPILRNLSFITNARYIISDVSGTEKPYSVDSLRYSANLFWRLPRTYISLGGSYSQTTKKDGETVENKLISFYANLSRYLTRRTFLNVYSTLTKDQTDKTTLEVRPRLSWTKRRTFVNVEYDYRRTGEPGRPASVEHRFFVRVIRRFQRVF